jgi:putative methionine-R-sulfoxide reductase with GAF domain
MANNDQLGDQLHDLFSDVELPEPESSEEFQEASAPEVLDESAETEAVPEYPPAPAAQPAKVERELAQQAEEQNQDADQLQALKRQISLLQQANYELQRRAIHLEASTAVSQAAVSILDPQELMQTTVDLIRERFKYYHVSFFLLDETEEWAVVRASTGEIGRKMVAEPHRLLVGGESMVGWVCQHRKPRIALDVGADAVHFDHPLLPHTRSEIALPLRVGDRLLGALDVQSVEENAFGNDDLRALQGMADLVAITLENARLFATTRKGTRHQRIVTAISERVQQAVSVDETLALTLEELSDTFDLARATICLGTESELQAVESRTVGALDSERSPQDTE